MKSEIGSEKRPFLSEQAAYLQIVLLLFLGDDAL